MSRRRIGQESFGFGGAERRHSSLDDLAKLIDWARVDRQLAEISCAAKGEPAWPPLALFKALLLAVWYDLSDVKLAEALDDRASFRRFCGFSGADPTPERTAFVRFRKVLTTRGLDRARVDATIVASASKGDDEARWVKHERKPAVHGFAALVGADADTALVEEIAVTPANVHDGKAGGDPRPDGPGQVFADSAHRGETFRAAVRAKGGTPRVVATHMWGRDEEETLAEPDAWDQPIHRIRGRIEKIFGTWKRSHGLRRIRWLGPAKAFLQIRPTAIAHDMRRALSILAVAA
jgi:IS5 family transposase